MSQNSFPLPSQEKLYQARLQIQPWEKTGPHQTVKFEHEFRDFRTQCLQSDCPKAGLLSKNFAQLGPSKAYR